MPKAVGIDIGSEALKGLVLSATGRGPMEVLAAGTLPLGDLGHMEDSQDKTLALGEKLRQLVKSANLRGSYHKVGASGKATSLRYLQVPPVPPWRLDMLVKYEVEERVADKETNTYDYQILDIPEAAGQYTVMIGMLKEAAATDLLAMGRAGGLGEVEIDLEAMALFNAYFHGHGFDSDKTVLVADIGADDLAILLCHNGSLYFARTVMGAGRRFTQALADDLKVEFEEAEAIKKGQAEISFDVSPGASRVGRFTRTGATATMPRVGTASGIPRGPATAAQTQTQLQSPAQKTEPRAPGATATVDTRNGAAATTSVPAVAIASGNGDRATGNQEQQQDELAPSVAKSTPAAPPTETQRPATPDADDLEQALPTVMLKMPDEPSPAADAPAAAGISPPLAAATAASASQPADAAQAASKSQFAAPAAPDGPEERRKRQVSNALLREAAALCATLENAVQVCKQQTKMREIKIDRLYVTGGGSRLKGLGEFMSRRMRVEVMPLEPFRQLSLDRLPPEQAAALKAEQHTLAVATGLALSTLQKHALGFLLWPEPVKQRKAFWSRGAYLYYAAALLVTALGLFLFTPYRNAQALSQNFAVAGEGFSKAKAEDTDTKRRQTEYEEKRAQLKQILEHSLSGHRILNLLAELKNKTRITDDIYLTSLSTKVPEVVVRAAAGDAAGTGTAGPTPGLVRDAARPAETDPNAAPETFQTQRVIYLRGFVVGNKDGAERVKKFREFYWRLVPDPENPDNPNNIFKDVRVLWLSPDDVAPEDKPKPKPAEDKGAKPAEDKKGKPAEDKKTNEGERFAYLTEFVIEGYVEGTREKTPAKKGVSPAADQKTAGATAAPPGPVVGGAPAPAVPLVQPKAVPEVQPKAVPEVQPKAVPEVQPKVVPEVQAKAVPEPAPAAPEEDKKPKKKKWTAPADQPQAAQPVAPVAPVAPAAPGPVAPPAEAKKN